MPLASTSANGMFRLFSRFSSTAADVVVLADIQGLFIFVPSASSSVIKRNRFSWNPYPEQHIYSVFVCLLWPSCTLLKPFNRIVRYTRGRKNKFCYEVPNPSLGKEKLLEVKLPSKLQWKLEVAYQVAAPINDFAFYRITSVLINKFAKVLRKQKNWNLIISCLAVAEKFILARLARISHRKLTK